jgi:hypothetical protein
MSRRKFLIGGAASVVAAATLPMTALAANSEPARPGDNQKKKQGKQIMNTITTKDGTQSCGQGLDISDGLSGQTNGYPGFILNRDIRSDVFETKLVWRPAIRLKATLTYQITSTDYSSKTDPAFDPGLLEQVSAGGPILDGTYNAQTYGLGMTVTPFRRLYFSGSFTYSWSRAVAADNGAPSIVPYQGDIYTLNSTASYVLDPKTSLQAAYNFSSASYGENNAFYGVPLGLNYTRRDLSISLTRKFNLRVSVSLRYAFFPIHRAQQRERERLHRARCFRHPYLQVAMISPHEHDESSLSNAHRLPVDL